MDFSNPPAPKKVHHHTFVFLDPRTTLLYLAVLSLLLLLFPPFLSLLQALHARLTAPRISLSPEDELESPPNSDDPNEPPPILVEPPTAPPRLTDPDSQGISGDFREHVRSLGGFRVFAWNALRFLGCLALVGMTIAAVVVDEEGAGNKGAGSGAGMVPGGGVRGERAGKKVVGGLVEVLKWKKGKKKGKGKGGIKEEFGREEWVEICQAGFFLYTLLLSLLTLTVRRPLPLLLRFKAHLTLLLLYALSLYVFRNLLYPLFTHSSPLDIIIHRGKKGLAWNGWVRTFVWGRLATLAVIGGLVPVFCERVAFNGGTGDGEEEPKTFVLRPSIASVAYQTYIRPFSRRTWNKMSGNEAISLP